MSLPRRELAHEVRHVHDANPRRIDACILQRRLPDLGHEGLERRALAHDDARVAISPKLDLLCVERFRPDHSSFGAESTAFADSVGSVNTARFTSAVASVVMAAVTPGCLGTAVDVDEAAPVEASQASALTSAKSSALISSFATVMRTSATARAKLASLAASDLVKAPIVGVFHDRVQLAVPVVSLLQDPAIVSAVVAASGGASSASGP